MKNCCRTRWLEKIESFDIFTEMYPAVVASLTYICTNTGGHWNNDSITLASSLLSGITTFNFLITLVVVKRFMRYLKSLTTRLQEKGADLSKAYQHVQTMQSTLVSVREEIEDKHDLLFEAASKIASENNISVLRPRTCNVQKYRENHDAEDVSSYYRVSRTLPSIDSLITSMAERFTPKNLALYYGFNILPSIMLKTDHWTTYFKEFFDVSWEQLSILDV